VDRSRVLDLTHRHRPGSVDVRHKDALCILCALGFLALGCQAGGLQWSSSRGSPETQPIYQPPPISQGAPGAVVPDDGVAGRPVRPVKVARAANCLPGSEFIIHMKYHSRAAHAYQRYRRSSGAGTVDFKRGFEQGYIDLARGGLGRTPVTAPHQYWGPAYRTPDGQLRQEDWLAGYTAGTQMSQVDGLGLSYTVATNPEAQYYRNESPSWVASPPR
jgi:hypothetical protein